MDLQDRLAVIRRALFPAVLLLEISGLRLHVVPLSLPALALLVLLLFRQRRQALGVPSWWSAGLLAATALGFAALAGAQVAGGGREYVQAVVVFGLGAWAYAQTDALERRILVIVLGMAHLLLAAAVLLALFSGSILPYSATRLALLLAVTFPCLLGLLVAGRRAWLSVPAAFFAFVYVTPDGALALCGAIGGAAAVLTGAWLAGQHRSRDPETGPAGASEKVLLPPARQPHPAWPVLAGYALGALVLAVVGSERWEMRRVQRPETGNLTRVHLEWLAVPYAVAAAPVWGHGLGRYKDTIHRYFVRFPDPADNRVPEDANSTWQVLPVEAGLPAALLLAAWLLTALTRSLRRTGGDAMTAGMLGVFLLASLFTPVVNRNTGLLLGACLGFAGPVVAVAAGGRLKAWLARGALVVAGLTVATALNLLLPRAVGGVATPKKPLIMQPQAQHQAVYFLLDATQPLAPPDGVMSVKPANDAVNNRALVIPEGAGKGAGTARYTLAGLAPGDYTIWVRAYWDDGCGNSIGVVIGGEEIVVTDEIFKRWHWVSAVRRVHLAGGQVELRLQNTEDGIMLDQLLLTPDPGFAPQGIVAVPATGR